MFQEALTELFQRKNLSHELMESAMQEILTGNTSPVQTASFLTALRVKGESVSEITSAVKVLRGKATPISTVKDNLIDTCGTGGDGSGTFNISTTSAIVAASAGVPVAKHGNKAMSSACGSANVLQELGLNLDLTPDQVGKSIDEVGIGFLFALKLHGAMKHVGPVRMELKQRTIFNLLGPMLNPAGAKRQVIGVYSKNIQKTVAQVLQELGSMHVLVVHAEDGMDEISLSSKTSVIELKNGKLSSYTLNPEDMGFRFCNPADLKGGDAATNAKIINAILTGEKGPKRDIVLLNAGAAIYVGGKADSIEEGVDMASKTLDAGDSLNTLNKLIDFSKANS